MQTKSEMLLNLKMSEYSPEKCKKLIEWMGKGKSFNSFAGKIDVTVSTLKTWLEVHEEFKIAKELGDAKSLEFWEENLMSVATGEAQIDEDGNKKPFGHWESKKFKLINSHPDDYKDKVDVKHTGDVIFQVETGVPRLEPSKKIESIEVKP